MHGHRQPWRRAEDRQGGKHLILSLVCGQGGRALWAQSQMFLEAVLLGNAQFAIDSKLLPYLMAAHLSSPLRKPA
jgi:hypothetical protein